MKVNNQRTCKNAKCKKKFERLRANQCVCSPECSLEYTIELSRKKDKKYSGEKKKAMKEAIMTHKDYLKLLQVVFNTFIRERDRGKPCICCNKPLTDKYDAGHFYSVGGNPALRFNEDNVHGQRSDCNQHHHGRLIDYTYHLPLRIGDDRFDALRAIRHSAYLKLSIPEIKEKIVFYKLKIKELK